MLSDITVKLKEMEEAIEAEEAKMFGNVQASGLRTLDLERSPKYKEVLKILHASPILVEPTLRWLQKIQSKLAAAQLSVLYTSEELEELRKQYAAELK